MNSKWENGIFSTKRLLCNTVYEMDVSSKVGELLASRKSSSPSSHILLFTLSKSLCFSLCLFFLHFLFSSLYFLLFWLFLDTLNRLATKNFEKRCRLRKTNKRTRCVKNECFSARDILWGRIKHYEKSSLRSHYRFRCALTSVPTPFGFLLLRKKNRYFTVKKI